MLPISHSALKVLKATHYPLNRAQRDDGRWNIDHVTAPPPQLALWPEETNVTEQSLTSIFRTLDSRAKLPASILRIKAIK